MKWIVVLATSIGVQFALPRGWPLSRSVTVGVCAVMVVSVFYDILVVIRDKRR